MSCKCGAHFCAACPNDKKDIFLTATLCYEHLNKNHGDIYDN
jgi:hypothetical protein